MLSKKFSIAVILFGSLSLNGCGIGIDKWYIPPDLNAKTTLTREALAVECVLVNGASEEFCRNVTKECGSRFKEIFPDITHFQNEMEWEEYYKSIVRVARRVNYALEDLIRQQTKQSPEQVTERYIEILTAYSTFTKGEFTSTDIQKIMMFRQQCYLDKFSQ